MKKNTIILSVLILIIVVLLFWIAQTFQTSEVKISKELKTYQIKEVESMIANMERYLIHKYGYDLLEVLKKKPYLRNEINMYLTSFISIKIKNLFIVYKPTNEKFFRVIADGSRYKDDRFAFNEKFEPLNMKYWEEVLIKKKPIVFKQKISNIWTTLLFPIVKSGKVKYIIVTDFSTFSLNMINLNMRLLKNNLKNILFFMILTIFILMFFLFYDLKRQKRMEELIYKLKELNETLEEKVKEEIRKNREKEKQLILQSRLALMGELLSMIAHQWRQPLNVINIIISKIKIKSQLEQLNEKDMLESLDKIEEYVKHLSNTIDDFRKFYRNEEQKRYVKIQDIVGQTLNIAEASLKNKNILINTDIKCNSDLFTYPNELKQVILNIIRNAEDIIIERKISPGKIDIRVYFDKDKCVIEIEDNAGGIKEDIIDKIFDPYFTTKDEKNGTGLGLYMSKQIVRDRLKGELIAYNGRNGAVFKIELKVLNG